MPKKSIKKKEQEDEVPEEGAEKIGLKSEKPEGDDSGQMDTRWKKVESVVNAAKEAYQSGESSFRDVVESMVSTLQDLLASEEGTGELGGLGGGPQMDLPEELAPEEEQQ